jgi:hypothetical protein
MIFLFSKTAPFFFDGSQTSAVVFTGIETFSFLNKGQQTFTPPSSDYGQDWVLVLDDASKNYSLPK